MAGQNIPMTKENYANLQVELEHMKKVERPRIIQEISEARAQGDLAENAEYHAAKERQGMIEGKIMEIEDKLARSEVITASAAESGHIIFGARVKVRNLSTKKDVDYILVGSDEVDITEGKISASSPIGKGLLGKRVGEKIEVHIPKGKLQLEILAFN